VSTGYNTHHGQKTGTQMSAGCTYWTTEAAGIAKVFRCQVNKNVTEIFMELSRYSGVYRLHVMNKSKSWAVRVPRCQLDTRREQIW